MKKIIVGNWKMNPATLQEARRIFKSVKNKAGKLKKTNCIICPPSIYIETLNKAAGSSCQIGGQDSFWEAEGAHTGEISPAMLKKLGVQYVVLGHSEKRETGDTNEIVSRKVKLALDYRLNIILCVGETERDEEGEYISFLSAEIEEGLRRIPPQYYKNIVIAYEPIWAIGSRAKGASTPEDFLEKSIFIRKVISRMTNKKTAMRVPILYGGSADDKNACGFMKEGKADGLLVGRASLEPKQFNIILDLAESL